MSDPARPSHLFSYGMASSSPDQRVPPQARTLAMWLLMVSLGMFFFGALVAFLIIRTSGVASPPPGSITMPVGLWFSTAFLLGCSIALHVALLAVRRERQRLFCGALITAGTLAVAFLIAQAISLPQLLAGHTQVAGQLASYGIYGFLWALIVVHAAHVMMALVPLAVTTVRGLKGCYDHEVHLGVAHCVMFWHFLDAVWLAMLTVFVATA